MDHPDLSSFTTAQANALAALVELESRWENIPVAAGGASPGESLRDLTAKQRAFDAYRDGLVAYNRQFRPAHHGERPATTPKRLGAWCRKMAGLYGRADAAVCPVQLLAKARRCAGRLAARLGETPFPDTTVPANVADAVADLGSVADWCDRLAAARAAAGA
jgi:hypothetical protein